MEEHEVELIDYLRTIWWGKWIILGCLIVAEILLREYVTAALAGDRDATAAMTDAVEFTLIDVEIAVPGIAASLAGGDRITLSRSAAASSDAVSEALAQSRSCAGAAVTTRPGKGI